VDRRHSVEQIMPDGELCRALKMIGLAAKVVAD
jgi:hypothetical protein